MHVTINGESHEVAEGLTVSALLKELALEPAATVVERNGDILERSMYATAAVEAGDVYELVRFVGGG